MHRLLFTRGIASVAAVAVSFALSDLARLAMAGVLLYGGVALCSGTKATLRLIGATLVMAVPLALVHGIINPQFAATHEILGAPLRVGGLEFAMVTSLKLALLFGVVGLWIGTPRSTWIALVAASRVPPAWGVALLQAITLSHLLALRITRIRQAQRARGVLRDDMGLLARAGAAVAVIVPLTAITLIDAAERGELLHRMGLGSYALAPTAPLGPAQPVDAVCALCVTVAALSLLFA